MDEININHNDIFVILDDDQLIHDAWDLRLNPLAKLNSKLIVRHEKQGQAVLDYVNSLGPQDKKRLYFLCDFELIGQSMNGLQVIEASEIERAVLVTNYHLQPAIQESALKLGIKILPKQMTSVAPFYCTQKHCFLKLNVDQIRCGRDLFNVEQLQEEYCV